MLFFPNTKINIGLRVINKRSDGYHNIETVFCPVGLSDILEFIPSPDAAPGHINFTITGLSIEGPVESNLCVKAYRLLHNDFKLPAIEAHLHKIVPPGAGLGGGSADAAFMLSHLNKQFGLGLGIETLCEYASRLGSDCSFFILNRPLFGYERGNRFREIPGFPSDLHIALINPGIHVSTAEAYSGVQPGIPAESLESLIKLPVTKWKERIINDFESGVFQKHPVIRGIKEKLYETGALYASMSGSGSSVYGLFDKKVPAIAEVFPGLFCWTGKVIF